MIILSYADVETLMHAYVFTHGKTMDSPLYCKLVKIRAVMETTGMRSVDLFTDIK